MSGLTESGTQTGRFMSMRPSRRADQVLRPWWRTPYQADRPRHARDIRGRIGLALDCRFGPGPRTARCRARSSSGLQDSTVVDLDQGSRHWRW